MPSSGGMAVERAPLRTHHRPTWMLLLTFRRVSGISPSLLFRNTIERPGVPFSRCAT